MKYLSSLPLIGTLSGHQKLTIAVAGVLLASVTQAGAIPLPRPAPKARSLHVAESDPARQPPASADAPTPAQATPTQATPAQGIPAQGTEAAPNPIFPNLKKLFGSGFGTAAAPKFDANQIALADKVSGYLSSLQNVSGNFVQVGPDGSRSTGNFYLQKPGRIRFEYDEPSPIALVADGTSVIVRDRKLATQDVYPLSQTPLRYLLADRLNLLRDTNVTGITSDDVYISVTIEEKQALVGTSRLTLMVGSKDGKLKQWTVTDPQGYDTTVAVYNLDTTKKLDPGLFKIDYTSYPSGSN